MKKNTKSSPIVINVTGNNNTVVVNSKVGYVKQSKKWSIKTMFQALGKLIRSAFVNITVLLIEIFAKLG